MISIMLSFILYCVVLFAEVLPEPTQISQMDSFGKIDNVLKLLTILAKSLILPKQPSRGVL